MERRGEEMERRGGVLGGRNRAVRAGCPPHFSRAPTTPPHTTTTTDRISCPLGFTTVGDVSTDAASCVIECEAGTYAPFTTGPCEPCGVSLMFFSGGSGVERGQRPVAHTPHTQRHSHTPPAHPSSPSPVRLHLRGRPPAHPRHRDLPSRTALHQHDDGRLLRRLRGVRARDIPVQRHGAL